MTAFITVLFAYLLGSVPTGFLLGRLSGVDVREAGSGNVGAANVARVVGLKQGLSTLFGDLAKGFIPVFLSVQLGLGLPVSSLAGLAAFLGHLYPVFLRFQGGKGVATALGVFLALAPTATGFLVLIFLVVAAVSRIVSLASLVAAAFAPVVFWLSSGSLYLIGSSFLISLMVFFRHRDNIVRLIAGVEPRFTL